MKKFVVLFFMLCLCFCQTIQKQETPEETSHDEYLFIKDYYMKLNERDKEVIDHFFTIENSYFIELILYGIKDDKLVFSKEENKEIFKGKMDELLKALEENDRKKAKETINAEIINELNNWVKEDQVRSVEMALKATVFMLSEKVDKHYLMIDFDEEQDNFLVYGWKQITPGEEATMIALVSNKKIFIEDPIFFFLEESLKEKSSEE